MFLAVFCVNLPLAVKCFQMSIEKVVKDINLVGEQIFDHTPVIKQENERILDNFERNERYKEFDGLIRASHTVWFIVFALYF